MVDSARNALIVASSDYADPELRRLRAPASDARALEAVLRDPGIGSFEVRTLLNRPNQEVALAVEDFFADRQPDDLLLVHFSCHGIKDEDGELYLAMADTLLRRLASTALAANFVNQRMTRSRSKRVVLLLDCCYAGAFERGMMPRDGGGMGIEAQFGGGRGRAVITASDAMQYAYEGSELAEGGELAATGELTPSVFTSALVSGLETGEADRDQDGKVALDELYDYIYEQVHEATPNQTPCKWTYDVRGDLFIARRSRPVTTPAPLPGKLEDALDNPFPEVRAGTVRELDRLLHGRHEGLALAARLALQQLTDDDSRAVAAAATAALATEEPPAAPPKPEPSTTDDDSRAVAAAATAALATEEPPAAPPKLEPSTTSVEFGPLTQHSQSPEHSIRLGNTGGGNLNAHAVTQASWIRLRHVDDELNIAVDTDAVGEHEGTVTVDSAGGSATILVKARIVPAPEPGPQTPAPEISGPPTAAPAVDRSTRSDPRPETASGGDQPVLAQARPAAETTPLPASKGRSGAEMLLDAGFILLTVSLFINALDTLIPQMYIAYWPWWVILAASIIGIAVTVGAVRQHAVPASILLWIMAWSLIYSLTIVGFMHSSLTATLRTESIIGAVVSIALCVWIVVLLSNHTRNVDSSLAIFLGLASVAFVLAAIATGKAIGPLWNVTGLVIIASALVLPLALIRTHRLATASS
jgi:hypothetical protein